MLQNELRLRGVKIPMMDTQEALNLYLLLFVLLAQSYSSFPGHGAVAQREGWGVGSSVSSFQLPGTRKCFGAGWVGDFLFPFGTRPWKWW